MINKFILLLLFFILSLYADVKPVEQINKYTYAIQLIALSSNREDMALKFLEELDKSIEEKTVIYEENGLITLRYYPSSDMKLLKGELQRIKKFGFKDAFIVKTLLYKLKESQKTLSYNPSNYSLIHSRNSETENYSQRKKLSKQEYIETLNSANKLKENNNLHESIEKYEALFYSSKDNKIVKNNLFYLYGKTTNWHKAKLLLRNFKRKDKLLYAYGLGSLENYSMNLEKELKSELGEDLSGYVNLILGVLKEREAKLNDAYQYYEGAYIRNRSDLYISFAFARAYELIQKYDLAQNQYQQITLDKSKKYPKIKAQALKRYTELKELSRLNIKE